MPLATRATAVKYAVAVVALTIWLATPPAAPAAPVASFSFSPTAPLTGEPVTFVSSSSGHVEPQRWGFDIDLRCDDAIGPTAQRSFPVAGAYKVTLCVTDGNDQGWQTRTVTVRNRPPAAAF